MTDIIMFEPFALEKARGEWGHYRAGKGACEGCKADDTARLCFHCNRWLCERCYGDDNPHLSFLFRVARLKLSA